MTFRTYDHHVPDDPETTKTPYVVTRVPPRGASDAEVRAWAESFAQKMIDAAGPRPDLPRPDMP